MNEDPEALEQALNAAAVLGAALARFQNALDRLRSPETVTILSPAAIRRAAERR